MTNTLLLVTHYLAVLGRRVKTIASPMLSMDWTSGAPWYGYARRMADRDGWLNGYGLMVDELRGE